MNPKVKEKLLALLADIEAMEAGEQTYGPFSEYFDLEDGMVVEWPNLEICVRQLREAMEAENE